MPIFLTLSRNSSTYLMLARTSCSVNGKKTKCRLINLSPHVQLAACGIRDPTLNYHRHDVSSLPSLFELSEEDTRNLEAIGTMPLVLRCDGSPPSYFSKEVDISCIVSSANINGTHFHLHPELEDYALTSSVLADQSIPEHFKMIQHEVELGFAFTDYKVQGRTIDYFVLCLAPRTFPPHFTLNSFAMLFSRVRTGEKLFALGLKDTSSKSTQHLRQLKHSVQIVLWEHGYDSTGIWSPELVNRQAEKIAKVQADRKPKTNKRKRTDHSVLPEAK